MEFEDYWRILQKQWRLIAVAALIGAVLGATITLVGGRGTTPTASSSSSAYLDVVPLSEVGTQEYSNALNAGSNYRVITSLEITNPNSNSAGQDYRELLTSESVVESAASQLDLSPNEIQAAIGVEPGTDESLVTFTVTGESSDSSQAIAEQVTEAFRNALATANQVDASVRLLLTTESPNPQIATSAGYTASRMPTYAALATSPALLDAVARTLGLEPGSLTGRVSAVVDPGTTIVTIRVDPGTEVFSASSVLTELTSELRAAIEAIEQTPVTFDNLGPRSVERSSVRRVGFEIIEPTVFLGSNPSDDARTQAQLLGTLITANPTVGVRDVQSAVEALQRNPEFANAFTPTAVVTVSIAPEVAEGEQAPAVPRAKTIRIAASAESEREAQETIEAVAQKLQENPTGLTDNAASTFVVVQSTAASPIASTVAEPSSSRLPVNIVLGLILGAAAGMGYALWSANRDGTIASPRSFARVVGTSPIGIITNSTAEPSQDSGGVGFRALRTNVLFGLDAPTSIAVVSPTSDTGTHTVGLGLAQVLADTSRTVAVIDTTGRSTNSVNAATSGARDDQPVQISADQLGDFRRMRDRLTELSQDFDHVVVLCPPAASDPAAAEISAQCSSTLLVVRVEHTTATEIDITARILLQTSTSIGGVVVNGIPPQDITEWARLLPSAPADVNNDATASTSRPS